MTKRMTRAQRRRRRQRNRRILFFAVSMLVVILLLVGIILIRKPGSKDTGKSGDEKTAAEETQQEEKKAAKDQEPETVEPTPEAEPIPLPQVDLSSIDSEAAILIRLTDQSVVAGKNPDARIYPASMTKIMTAIVGIENFADMDQLVTIDRETYDSLYEEGASLAGFQPGDQVKALDILYGVMLPSGAECCIGMADTLFGSEEAFVEQMNVKARELGMTNTHFVTSTGLHDENHYTTVEDMAKLLEYALQNETFRTIYCSSSYTSAPTASSPEGLTFYSTMFKHMDTPAVNGGEIEGGKTGYTSEAGQCLASLAKVDDTEYILVTAKAHGSPSTEAKHIIDAKNVYNQIQ